MKRKHKDPNVIHKQLILNIVDQVINMCPEIKPKRAVIINNIFNPPPDTASAYVLERIIIDNNTYYFDYLGSLFDCNLQIVGVKVDDTFVFKHELKPVAVPNL